MQSNHKKRICIVSRSLSEGGADRVAAMQSIFLTNLGYEVFIMTILNSIKYPYKGELFNLGVIKEQNDSVFGRFNRLLLFKRFLVENKVDVVIDHRVRCKPFSEYIISGLIYPKDTIYIVHNFTIKRYFPPIQWLTKRLYRKAKKIVTVSKGIEKVVQRTYNFNNLQTIYNPIDFEYINRLKAQEIDVTCPFIFWYGRFEEAQKNVSLLVDAYSKSDLSAQGIKLILMGNGKDKTKIANKITDLNLKNSIEILPFSDNPFAYINKSKFTVLSSNHEGFPMTVLESLACGIPVVSVAYQNYEDGVIINESNGLLVENHNPLMLAKALNRFIVDEKLYLRCKANAKNSVETLSVQNISKQWKTLIES
ncbi:glycosyltransferase involved in cell wall biosynthesis [Winogradskyella epiphytica]|uniref:Glycosyltransferase involved in cell wall biosynthesis n=1 Tax=Winogradskyella epiphytica TaxID=262005 RepID=A0A2V4WUK9_9FLAO|nr:glycosyltransferase [Winogradskyella epiphytica]PYE80118.1 glycosyltransferase involved in cell wall biosynthesis [Winogradskyella epiphytica]GGW71549.1 glycosyl transferase [Winogradskyella epiphytica]